MSDEKLIEEAVIEEVVVEDKREQPAEEVDAKPSENDMVPEELIPPHIKPHIKPGDQITYKQLAEIEQRIRERDEEIFGKDDPLHVAMVIIDAMQVDVTMAPTQRITAMKRAASFLMRFGARYGWSSSYTEAAYKRSMAQLDKDLGLQVDE